MKKRIVNLRPLFISLIFLILGIVCYTNIFLSGENSIVNIYYFLFLGILLLFAILLPFAFLKTPKLHKSEILYSHKNNIALAFVFVLIGFFIMHATTTFYNKKYPEFSGVYSVVGEIEDDYYEKNGVTIITLNNVVATNDNGVFKVPSRAKLVVFSTGIISKTQINAGNSMQFNATITKTPFNKNGYNFSSYFNNYIYDLKSVDSVFSYSETGMDLDELIRDKYKQTLHKNTTFDIANLSFSLLFGNDEVLSTGVKDLFTATGVVHIISVSGLHVAVLVGAVMFLLNRLKLNKKLQLLIVSFVLLFYCYLCGFSPTVIRSAIMFIVLLIGLVIGEQYDALSSLSFAGIVLLLISPIWLFSLGFQLSFLSMFAIITLAPIFSKALEKIKLPKALSISVGLTFAVTLITLPLIALYFNSVAVYSAISNLIAVPIMSVSYVMIFAITTVALLFPFTGALLVVPSIFLHFSKLVLLYIQNLPASTIRLFSDGYITLILLLIIAFIARFFMIKKSYKVAISVFLSMLVVAGFLFANLPNSYNYYSFKMAYQRQSDAIIITTNSGNNILLASSFVSDEVAGSLLAPNKINKIESVVLYSYSYIDIIQLKDFSKNYNINNIYFYGNGEIKTEFLQAQKVFENAVFVDDDENVSLHGVGFEPVVLEGDIFAIKLEVQNKSAMIINKNAVRVDYLRMSYLQDQNFDVVVTPQSFGLNNYNIFADVVISESRYSGDVSENYNLKELSNFTIML